MLLSQDGTESVWVHRGDGLAIGKIKARGIPQWILSMERNPVVARRAEKLGIPVSQGIGNKLEVLKAYAAEHRYDASRIIYVGNDINDLEAMKWVGYPMCPNDGVREILAISKVVFEARGGYGVIRELWDWILRNQ